MTLVIGVTFRAIPGATEHIVLRPATATPPGWLPPDYDGRWSVRPKHASVMGLGLAYATAMGAQIMTALPTGRVEIRDDGAIAEVYEVSA
jgi:hypothetical protein